MLFERGAAPESPLAQKQVPWRVCSETLDSQGTLCPSVCPRLCLRTLLQIVQFISMMTVVGGGGLLWCILYQNL